MFPVVSAVLQTVIGGLLSEIPLFYDAMTTPEVKKHQMR
jgi:hypothetical protein